MLAPFIATYPFLSFLFKKKNRLMESIFGCLTLTLALQAQPFRTQMYRIKQRCRDALRLRDAELKKGDGVKSHMILPSD